MCASEKKTSRDFSLQDAFSTGDSCWACDVQPRVSVQQEGFCSQLPRAATANTCQRSVAPLHSLFPCPGNPGLPPGSGVSSWPQAGVLAVAWLEGRVAGWVRAARITTEGSSETSLWGKGLGGISACRLIAVGFAASSRWLSVQAAKSPKGLFRQLQTHHLQRCIVHAPFLEHHGPLAGETSGAI